MNKNELLVVEQELLRIIQENSSISQIKGFLCKLYMRDHVSDKYMFKKIFKLALKVLNNKEIESFSVDYLTDCIDKCWEDIQVVSFEKLSLELIRRLKNVQL